ncbi:hypothetical protein [Pleomorphomonas koreensis]|uniref:hypothetical protein n=1 Tax=Pleomorphomonas koreensis TaxID=257440 RepID=UPI0012EC0BFC|nr:hypothetical protein [Pleomorphomonas koreensis]
MTADDRPPGGAFTVATADPDKARAAVEAGARGVLMAITDDFAPADRMAVTLSVAEAELGLADGALSLIVEIAGPGGALRLAHRSPVPGRLAMLGIDLEGFGRGAAGGADAPRLTAAGLVALAAAAHGLPAYLRGSGSLMPDGRPAFAGFTHLLVAGN